MLNITRFSIHNKELTPWVKFIWFLETEAEVTVYHKLLPSDSIDIILNLSDQIEYQIGDERFIPNQFHFNGIRDRHGYVLQQGKLKVFGISFYPFGLYPILRKPLSGFTNRIVDLKSVSEVLQQQLELVFHVKAVAEKTVPALENALAAAMMPDGLDRKAAALLLKYVENCQTSSIRDFCAEQHIHIRTFERLCMKYAGYPPKTLQRIARFQRASNRLIDTGSSEKLTELAYDSDYYDQAHFIKEFQDFSGTVPSRFLKEKDTVKENAKYIYK